jgi:hypothetical protein
MTATILPFKKAPILGGIHVQVERGYEMSFQKISEREGEIVLSLVDSQFSRACLFIDDASAIEGVFRELITDDSERLIVRIKTTRDLSHARFHFYPGVSMIEGTIFTKDTPIPKHEMFYSWPFVDDSK